MTREEQLLVRAMEECNEVAQRLSKALIFGMDRIQRGTDDKLVPAGSSLQVAIDKAPMPEYLRLVANMMEKADKEETIRLLILLTIRLLILLYDTIGETVEKATGASIEDSRGD